MVEIIEKSYDEAIRDGIKPAHCAILRPVWHIDVLNLDIDLICHIIETIPIEPMGSIWLRVNEFRNVNGALLKFPEKILSKVKLFVADKISCFTGKNFQRNKQYLIPNSYWFRFTKIDPNKCWFFADKFELFSVWSRSSDEGIDWYRRQIALTCPENGTVLDPYCHNSFILEAALKENRNFLGIGDNCSKLKHGKS